MALKQVETTDATQLTREVMETAYTDESTNRIARVNGVKINGEVRQIDIIIMATPVEPYQNEEGGAWITPANNPMARMRISNETDDKTPNKKGMVSVQFDQAVPVMELIEFAKDVLIDLTK